MTAKFEAFKAALMDLCQSHGVKIVAYGYDSADLYVDDLGAGEVLQLDLNDDTSGTDEEQAVAEAERQQRIAEHTAILEEDAKRRWTTLEALAQVCSPASFAKLAEVFANEERSKQMRVSTDPTDSAYTEARPRVWLGEREILDWITADEFRRVVITVDGPLFGAVRVERLPEPGVPEAAPMVDTGLSGVFEKVPEVAPAPDFTQPTVEVKPAVIAPAKRVKRGKK